jgi:hypothetical protein
MASVALQQPADVEGIGSEARERAHGAAVARCALLVADHDLQRLPVRKLANALLRAALAAWRWRQSLELKGEANLRPLGHE